MNKVVIIGSGCSALAACYSLSKNKNNKITLITADDSLGKNILSPEMADAILEI